MEKGKINITSIICIVLFLVIVAGASFAYFGTFSYNEFKLKCKKGMRISENGVKELCVKII